jgi:hypothetical protein
MDQITKINLSDGSDSAESSGHLEGNAPMEKSKILVPLILVAIIAGAVSGSLFAKQRILLASSEMGITDSMTQNPEDASAIKPGAVFGSPDEKTFRDSAEGIIQPGGIAGEGSHHLERGEDESQWVYLTSSVVDLDNFVSHKVTIWGETVGAKKAGWLMDVGRLKVLETNAAEINEITTEE